MSQPRPAAIPAFQGFPYLITRIGHTPLRHVSLLPADWPRDRLAEVAREQARATRLETCLCLGPGDALYVHPDGAEHAGSELPVGVPVLERLELPEPVPETPEILARRAALRAFAEGVPASGYLVGDGLEGGRRATRDDLRRLGGRDRDGVPVGLVRCTGCGSFRGEYLALDGEGNGDAMPRVVQVHCGCENHNRCARCGGALADRRLSAYSYDEASGRIRYLAAYAALGHRCPGGARPAFAGAARAAKCPSAKA